MQFAHIMLLVNDMEKAVKLWCDTLGFVKYADVMLPDGDPPEHFFTKEDLDNIWGCKDAQTHFVSVYHPQGGAMLELQQSINPPAINIPREERRYRHQGIREIALYVTGIEELYEKVKAAGYEVQTDYIWVTAGYTKSFLFYDDDGNQIQFCELAQQPQG